jgi:hypothetical protein
LDYLMSLIKNNKEFAVNESVVKEIVEALNGLDYGSIVIKVHNKKVVQVEVTQRKRFDDMYPLEKGGGI